VLAVCVIVMVIIEVASSVATQRKQSAWAEFARTRNLAYANDRIAGVVDGFTIALLVEERGTGRDRHFTMVARCSLADALPAEFTLQRETLGSKLAQLVGEGDHQLGDPQMDSTFLLGQLGDQARRVLTDRAARDALLAWVDKYPSLRIGHGALQLEMASVPSTVEGLAVLLHDAVTLAKALQRAATRP
jgi:hypothetical protein